MKLPIATASIAFIVSPAMAVTINQFDAVTEQQQAEWMAAHTLLLQDWYQSNGHEDIAACMTELRGRSRAAAEGDHSQGMGLYALINDEIRIARRKNTDEQVENIIAYVVQRECAKPESQQ